MVSLTFFDFSKKFRVSDTKRSGTKAKSDGHGGSCDGTRLRNISLGKSRTYWCVVPTQKSRFNNTSNLLRPVFYSNPFKTYRQPRNLLCGPQKHTHNASNQRFVWTSRRKRNKRRKSSTKTNLIFTQRTMFTGVRTHGCFSIVYRFIVQSTFFQHYNNGR